MGIYRPLVTKAQGIQKVRKRPTSEKILTPATTLTAARPFIGGIAMYKMIRGKHGATKWALAGAISDMEGMPARGYDRVIERLRAKHAIPPVFEGRGATVTGERADPVADGVFVLEVATGIVLGKKTHIAAKFGAGLIIKRETQKGIWFSKTSKRYDEARAAKGLEPEQFVIPVDDSGKEAMVEEMVGIGLGAFSSEFRNPAARAALGVLSLAHAIVGTSRGHKVQKHYAAQAEAVIAGIGDGSITTITDYRFAPMPTKADLRAAD